LRAGDADRCWRYDSRGTDTYYCGRAVTGR